MKRNPDATCSNCPYGNPDFPDKSHWPPGYRRCQVGAPAEWNVMQDTDWCGKHPSFLMDTYTVDVAPEWLSMLQSAGGIESSQIVSVDSYVNPTRFRCWSCGEWIEAPDFPVHVPLCREEKSSTDGGTSGTTGS